jgi:adenosine deaminase/adenosine deaminase CECR1
MQMRACHWLQKQFPEVNIALHAGELTANLVAEEHLKFHIAEAVSVAGAKRIGHGVDLCSEHDFERILTDMREADIAIEILPTSNDFILRIADAAHPFERYFRAGLPIVVASDDPGLLRCTLAEEYLRLAQSYPFLEYEDFKQFSFNSLKYSFLDADKKTALMEILESRFEAFEAGGK